MISQEPFEGHVIAITGAGSGIGAATARYLAERGAHLSLADVRKDAVDLAAAEILTLHPKANVITSEVDVRRADQVEAWISKTIQYFGKLTGAANLAGVTGKGLGKHKVTEIEASDYDLIMDVNLKGVFHCLQAQLKAIEDGGSIVNAASIAGLIGFPKNSIYSASKHAVIGLSRSAAKECSDTGVRINVICPGSIETPMTAHITDEWKVERPAVIKRKGRADEVAALIAYLLGSESTFTTGAVYPIDGGWYC